MKRRHTSKSSVRTRKISREENDFNQRIRFINEGIRMKDLHLLRKLGQTGNGFVEDGLRRRVWPILLHCAKVTVTDDWDEKKAEEHKDERQVLMDVERSLNNYPIGLNSESKKQKQDDLNDIIVEVLRKNPLLHYYQGYHDICACFLIVMGKVNAIPAVENVSLFLIRDAMMDSLDPVLRQLVLINEILKLEDPEVFDFLEGVGVLPYYCLSWILTWCSHDITDFSKVARLFDFFLTSNPLMTVYFAAAVVLSRRDSLLKMELDSAVIHHFLATFPQDLDINATIGVAIDLERKYSKEEVQGITGKGLDETSTVNTYSTLWHKLRPGDDPPKLEVERILSLLPAERKPRNFSPREPRGGDRQVVKRTAWTLLAVGAGVGTAVLVMLNNQAVRWVKTEMVVGWAMRDNGWRLSAR